MSKAACLCVLASAYVLLPSHHVPAQGIGGVRLVPGERLPRADIILASYEALVQDVAELSALQFETVVLDLRARPKGGLAKSAALLEGLTCRQKVLVLSADPATLEAEDMAVLATTILPEAAQQQLQLGQLRSGVDSVLQQTAVRRAAKLLEPHVCRCKQQGDLQG